MDIQLARTFMEIVTSGSFVAAAERLNLTQTAVSARVRTLEEQLGATLFVRNKSGARLTAAGRQFVPFATTLVQVWQRARQQLAIPPGRETLLSLGGELSLWNPLVAEWLLWMRREAPEIALRTHVDIATGLTDQIQSGVLDVAVLHAPHMRPGLQVELLMEEELILVNSAGPRLPDPEAYIYIDWGPAFAAQHDAGLPDLAQPGLRVDLGPLALQLLLTSGGAGYFRRRVVQPYLDQGRLHEVSEAPRFPYPIYAVFARSRPAALVDKALAGLRAAALSADRPWHP